MKSRSQLKRIWVFLWKSNSIWSWIANVIIAFVLIKFIIYPGLGLVMHTTHPIVAVVSESMDHRVLYNQLYRDYMLCGKSFKKTEQIDFDKYWQLCGEWYEKHVNITKEEFAKFPFHKGFRRGDIMVIIGKSPEKIKLGDIIVFKSNRPYPIIHRVVAKEKRNNTYFFQTKGDHNPTSLVQIGEDSISEDRIIGVAKFRIPWLGYVKIWFVELVTKLFGLK